MRRRSKVIYFSNFLDSDKRFKCFICDISNSEFSKAGENFNLHRENEHHPWNYIFFLVHLDEKEKDDFNGTESYIYEKAKAGDISWFPIGHALSLD